MKPMMIVGFAMAAMMLSSGCVHTHIITQPSAHVVRAAESLAPWSNPPRYKTVATAPGREWTVLITDNVPGQKFEHYEITFHIVRTGENQCEISVEAEHVDLMPLSQSRKSAPRIARRYADKLGASLKTEKPQPPPAN